jgi:2-keto-4-pentenoate hydratase/2-oxohepta-3-ene-1,7-dioic acid hydratase in catechol pathway
MMRIANLNGRTALIRGDHAIDVCRASNGRFPAEMLLALEAWDDLVDWAGSASDAGAEAFDPAALRAPVEAPPQIFAIGLNYREHARESGLGEGGEPTVFTKFRSCLTGPNASVVLPNEYVDWEVELVVVMGRTAERVREADAWRYVAGLTAGQDLSERRLQMVGTAPQFSLAKSFAGFGPMGPAVVSLDEFDNPDDLELGCRIDDEIVQQGRTRDMVNSVPQLIERLSRVCRLMPGDLIFTGTPSGVGLGRSPERYLKAGTELVTWVEGVGELHNRLISDGEAASPSAE